MTEHRRQRGLESTGGVHIQGAHRQTEFRREGAFARGAGEAAVAAIKLEPTGMPQIPACTRLRHQGLMFRDRAPEQRPHHSHGGNQTLWRGVTAELQQPGRHLRQEASVIIRLRRPLEGDTNQRLEAGRKRRRKQRIGLDDAGIAVGRALARFATVDQRDGEAALDEMQRHRDADNAGAKHDRVGASHGTSFAGVNRFCGSTLRGTRIEFRPWRFRQLGSRSRRHYVSRCSSG